MTEVAAETSPDGKSRVVVYYSTVPGAPVKDGIIKIGVGSDHSPRIVYISPDDRVPMVIQIAWNQDSRVVGVLEIDGLTTALVFAYDVRENRPVDSQQIHDELVRGLIKRFNLEDRVRNDSAFDPVKWVKEQAVFRKIPRIQLEF